MSTLISKVLLHYSTQTNAGKRLFWALVCWPVLYQTSKWPLAGSTRYRHRSNKHGFTIFKLVVRHTWLNLWDKHLTTGRINQVSVILQSSTKRFSISHLHPTVLHKAVIHLSSLSYSLPQSGFPSPISILQSSTKRFFISHLYPTVLHKAFFHLPYSPNILPQSVFPFPISILNSSTKRFSISHIHQTFFHKAFFHFLSLS